MSQKVHDIYKKVGISSQGDSSASFAGSLPKQVQLKHIDQLLGGRNEQLLTDTIK
jgi:hypothetical protein